MGISQPDIKLLWGRAASLCAICRTELTQDSKSTNLSFPVGEQAHIVAEKDNGPRGDSMLPVEERNSYHNLILLCPKHHIIIDRDVADFPVEKLYIIKSRHELWVRDTLEKKNNSTQQVFRPVSDLLWLVGAIHPILLWLNCSIPPDQAVDFFSDLQFLWHRGYAMLGIDKRVTFGMDLLLRPISSSHFLEQSGQGYVRSKLWGANRQFAGYFWDRGFSWDDFESAPETETILYYLEGNARRIQDNSEQIDKDELDIIKLILYIVSYCKTVQWEQNYVGISEAFVWQAHAAIEAYLERLGYKLPNAYDGEENEMLMESLSMMRYLSETPSHP